MRRWYQDPETPLSDEKLVMISYVNDVIDTYAAKGFHDLTLRQIYYQLVKSDLFPEHRKYVTVNGKWKRHSSGSKNAEPNYDWLGDIVRDGRLAGLIDWDAIVDRTRAARSLRHWNDPSDVVDEGVRNFRIQKWSEQSNYIEVWVEKDALVGILERACTQVDVDVAYFSCRGYSSSTALWEAAQRIEEKISAGHKVTVLYLGDHDPSGVDMTRDIRERMTLFMSMDISHDADMSRREAYDYLRTVFRVKRIALNMNQIIALDPPPNPTKPKDSRSPAYIEQFGYHCWELDAIPPDELVRLIVGEVRGLQGPRRWAKARAKEERLRAQLKKVKDRWADVLAFLEDDGEAA